MGKMAKFFKKLLKLITSRYFICSIFIILEISLIIYFEAYLMSGFIYFYVFSYIVSFLILLAVINKDTIGETKLPWVVVILVLPSFGALLYMMFGIRQTTIRERKFLKFAKQKNLLSQFEINDSLQKLKREDPLAYQKALALCKDSNCNVFQDSFVNYYPSGEECFKDLLEDLKKAEKFIFMEYFIICPGKMWEQILEILKEKASKGVEVRFIYDDIGSLFYVSDKFYKSLEKYNIKALCFAKYTGKANSSHNNRSHRKITVIDGKIAYTGGINLADEYINENNRLGYWKDSAIRIKGEAIKEFINLFLFDWNINKQTDNDWNKYLSTVNKINNKDEYIIPFGTGPKPIYQPNIAKNMFLNLINQAKNYVYITTPYLIVDKEIMNAFCNASKRGIDVRIITPHIPDKKLIYAVTKSSYLSLIKAGVKIYEFTPGFIHAKNVIIDDEYAVCGTINFDYRSLIHHYENAVWMYNVLIIGNMKDDFLETIKISQLISEEETKQKLFVRFFLGLISVFYPLL